MWHAIYTKPKREDSIAIRLRNIGIEVLNPKLKSRKYKNGQFLDVIEPLFPCYIFAEFETDKYSHLITYTRGVRYIVGKNNPMPVFDEVITGIRENMGEEGLIVIKPPDLKHGDKVIIKEGPFKDFYGIFERETRGPDRVMILLSALNCRIELDTCFLAVA